MTRLTSRFQIDTLLRRTQAAGGFATILTVGDAQSGSILIQCRDGNIEGDLLERRYGPTGAYIWESVGPTAPNDSADGISARDSYLERRRKSDPDLWVIELDIADATQFIADWAAIN